MADTIRVSLGPIVPGFVGDYSLTRAYTIFEVVMYQNDSWIATRPSYGIPPSVNGEHWSVIAKSIVGPQGSTGQTGATGPRGPTGTGLNIRGTFATVNDLLNGVMNPQVGDIYNVGTEAPFNLYLWDGVSLTWEDQGQLQGAQGEKGEQGGEGPQGERGEIGPEGPEGQQGEEGPEGPQGEAATFELVEIIMLGEGEEPFAEEAEDSTEQHRRYILHISSGPQGEQGEPGPQGQAATFEILNTITGSAGSPAFVVDAAGSNPGDRRYNLTVPEGQPGRQGIKGDPGLIYDLGDDYSFAEKPVMIFKDGVYRQKMWIDSSPVFCRVYDIVMDDIPTGTFPVQYGKIIDGLGTFRKIINSYGELLDTTNVVTTFPFLGINGTVVNLAQVDIDTGNNIRLFVVIGNANLQARLNNSFLRLYVEYTRTDIFYPVEPEVPENIPAGPPGPEGPDGRQGDPGPAGRDGIDGVDGADGVDGTDGRNFIIRGLKATIQELIQEHPVGVLGDAWSIGTEKENVVWIWDVDEQAWVNIGRFGDFEIPPPPTFNELEAIDGNYDVVLNDIPQEEGLYTLGQKAMFGENGYLADDTSKVVRPDDVDVVLSDEDAVLTENEGERVYRDSIDADRLDGNTIQMLQRMMVDIVWPIGSIYMSVDSQNPRHKLGGKWTRWGAGRVPVGVNQFDAEFKEVEQKGGAKVHRLSINEMAQHYHLTYLRHSSTTTPNTVATEYRAATFTGGTNYTLRGDIMCNSSSVAISPTDQPHNNIQPYVTCFMWKRIG